MSEGRDVSLSHLEPDTLVDARVSPLGSLENLSQREVAQLLSAGHGGVYGLFRRCALAVLSSGLETDDIRDIFDRYKDFDIRLGQQAWGIKLEVRNAPPNAFVDGQMIRGIKEHLFAVLRDIVYIHDAILGSNRFDLTDPAAVTNAVYHILRNARILDYKGRPDLVVCWGGHSISSTEYDYTKKVGYELGLRALSVCTGCGPGAMKGPMKGATIGHSKQRIRDGRYIGMTEPGIIAADLDHVEDAPGARDHRRQAFRENLVLRRCASGFLSRRLVKEFEPPRDRIARIRSLHCLRVSRVRESEFSLRVMQPDRRRDDFKERTHLLDLDLETAQPLVQRRVLEPRAGKIAKPQHGGSADRASFGFKITAARRRQRDREGFSAPA